MSFKDGILYTPKNLRGKLLNRYRNKRSKVPLMLIPRREIAAIVIVCCFVLLLPQEQQPATPKRKIL
jgi:hypothetical protein